MQTFLGESLKQTPDGREAEEILRACVHCGFCNATCPTYLLLGDERDGPRGRIYLIKDMLEGGEPTRETQLHLDRCLTCRACETTCPSGVRYHRLLEIGREVLEGRVGRPATERIRRATLLSMLPRPALYGPLLRLARIVRPLLPASLRKSIPPRQAGGDVWPQNGHPRKILLLQGCVQSAAAPQINLATARVLDRIGISAVPGPGCCGALAHHLAQPQQTRATARANIDAWWPQVERGIEAILLTASGCAPTVMDYGRLLRHDARYAAKAARISELAVEVSGFLAKEKLEAALPRYTGRETVAFHAPCTLQHGLKQSGRVEATLSRLGFQLKSVREPHLCCGSAGTYSILQKDLSQQLLARKLENLERQQPDRIATANIGCLLHLQGSTHRPVVHWIELLEDCLE
jgi:glycolate oxidase iron-sulfur subunit